MAIVEKFLQQTLISDVLSQSSVVVISGSYN